MAKGDFVLPNPWAAIRRVIAIRFFPLRGPRFFLLLLLSYCRGQTPSQLAKCFSVGKRLTSTPSSARITRAVATSITSISVRSTPNALNRGPHASTVNVFCLRPPLHGFGATGLPPARLGSLAPSGATTASHLSHTWGR